MPETCSNCLQPVEENLGYESRAGERLCGPCYFALWGTAASPRGSVEEAVRPQARRPAKPRGNWVAPGPTAELDVPAGRLTGTNPSDRRVTGSDLAAERGPSTVVRTSAG